MRRVLFLPRGRGGAFNRGLTAPVTRPLTRRHQKLEKWSADPEFTKLSSSPWRPRAILTSHTHSSLTLVVIASARDVMTRKNDARSRGAARETEAAAACSGPPAAGHDVGPRKT